MSLESALRELGKEIQKDERFAALQAAAKANDGDEKLQQQMQELQLISLKYQQEAEKANDADKDRIESCRPIIRNSMVRLWRAKICRSILPLLPLWRRWHSTSAV